jgi:acylphosphatase
MPHSTPIRQLVYYSGRVQGVGFRYTTCQIASRFAATGTVRNLPDGRVELIAEGTPAELRAFLGDIHAAMGGNIAQTDVHTLEATGEFKTFRQV